MSDELSSVTLAQDQMSEMKIVFVLTTSCEFNCFSSCQITRHLDQQDTQNLQTLFYLNSGISQVFSKYSTFWAKINSDAFHHQNLG